MAQDHLGEALPRLVEQIVASYYADARTHHVDKEYLPSKAAIAAICELLLELTYPGYFGREGLTRHNIGFHVGELLPRLWELLAQQIQRCLCHEQSATESEYQGRAGTLANDFIERIPHVRECLAADVQAAYDGDPAAENLAEIILAYPGLLAVTIYRYAHELYTIGVPLMPRIMGEHAHQLTGIDIHPGARIGRSFFIDHGTGVVIGETADIGDNVKIYQGVTLGALSFAKDERGRIIRGTKRHPTVGNNVTIYANAIVLGGGTKVGDGGVVGGSVFLTQSVQPGFQVAIAPPMLRLKPPTQPGATEPTWDI